MRTLLQGCSYFFSDEPDTSDDDSVHEPERGFTEPKGLQSILVTLGLIGLLLLTWAAVQAA